MFIISNYTLAVVFCFITMLCWGSWGNTQKLAGKTWRYELFYWDYVIGMVLFALLICFTMGSFGSEGRPFVEDIAQVSLKNVGSIILGGIIFNASNILLSASTSNADLIGHWGEKTYYAGYLRGCEYGLEPSLDMSSMPYGGELSKQTTRNKSYTARLQANISKTFDDIHHVSAVIGSEANSNRYEAFKTIQRGYFEETRTGTTRLRGVALQHKPCYRQ